MHFGMKKVGTALMVGLIAITASLATVRSAVADEQEFQQTLIAYNQAAQRVDWAKAKYEAAKFMARNTKKGWGVLVSGVNLAGAADELAAAKRDLLIAGERLEYAKTH